MSKTPCSCKAVLSVVYLQRFVCVCACLWRNWKRCFVGEVALDSEGMCVHVYGLEGELTERGQYTESVF